MNNIKTKAKNRLKTIRIKVPSVTLGKRGQKHIASQQLYNKTEYCNFRGAYTLIVLASLLFRIKTSAVQELGQNCETLCIIYISAFSLNSLPEQLACTNYPIATMIYQLSMSKKTSVNACHALSPPQRFPMGNWEWEGARENMRSPRSFVFFPPYHSTLEHERGLCGEDSITDHQQR